MSTKSKFILLSGFILILVLFLFLFLFYGRIYFFYETFEAVKNFITSKFGIHEYLVLAALYPITVLFYKFVILNFFSIKSKNQWKGFYIFSAFMFTFYIALYFFPKKVTSFDTNTGESNKCYTRYNGKIYRANCDWEFHEKYGTPVFKVTPKIIEEWGKQKASNKGGKDPYEVLEETEEKFKGLQEE